VAGMEQVVAAKDATTEATPGNVTEETVNRKRGSTTTTTTTTMTTTTTTTMTDSLGDRLTASIWSQNVMPQSMDKALESSEWIEVGSGSCHPKFGRRFQRKGVITPTMMYSNTGHIAGMQFGVNTETFPLYPDSNLKAGDSAVPTGLAPSLGDYAVTTYFTDPSKICNASPTDHVAGSIGDRLWVANASAPLGHEAVPLHVDDGMLDGYIPSGCAASGFAFPGSPGMGTHWWRMTKTNGETPCNEAGQMFLLYSKGRLVAMGMTFVGSDNRLPTVGNKRPVALDNGLLGPPGDEMWEFARQDLTPYFFKRHDNPKCGNAFNEFNSSLPNGTVTTATLHVFFSDPYNITCP